MKEALFYEGEPMKSTMLYTNQLFLYAGRLMALSILHRGKNPNILANWCFQYIVKQKAPSTIEPTKSFKERNDIKKVMNLSLN